MTTHPQTHSQKTHRTKLPWKKGQQQLCNVKIDGTIAIFSHVRDYDYRWVDTEADAKVMYHHDQSYDMSTITWVYLYSVPFGRNDVLSHMMLSFHFEDGRDITLSVEARRKEGESYAAMKWLMNYYKLIYVWWTKQDLVGGVRLYVRKVPVYEYQLDLTHSQAVKMFQQLIQTSHDLASHEQRYSTVTNNCVTNIRNPLYTITRKGRSWHPRLLYSGWFDRFLWRYHMIKRKGHKNFTLFKQASLIISA